LNAAQDHLEATAVAHVDRVTLESFLSAVAGCTDDAARNLLGRVCALHALSTIERHRAWYLEHDRLTPARSKLVTELVNHLCQELRPQAQTLVDAFGIPAEWLWTEMLAGG
ncbi:MAG: acyl-CoA dehydrogenase, partial [Lapillicoccus sp.]